MEKSLISGLFGSRTIFGARRSFVAPAAEEASGKVGSSSTAVSHTVPHNDAQASNPSAATASLQAGEALQTTATAAVAANFDASVQEHESLMAELSVPVVLSDARGLRRDELLDLLSRMQCQRAAAARMLRRYVSTQGDAAALAMQLADARSAADAALDQLRALQKQAELIAGCGEGTSTHPPPRTRVFSDELSEAMGVTDEDDDFDTVSRDSEHASAHGTAPAEAAAASDTSTNATLRTAVTQTAAANASNETTDVRAEPADNLSGVGGEMPSAVDARAREGMFSDAEADSAGDSMLSGAHAAASPQLELVTHPDPVPPCTLCAATLRSKEAHAVALAAALATARLEAKRAHDALVTQHLNKCAMMEAQVARLTDECAGLQTEVSTLRSKLHEARHKGNALTLEVESLRIENSRLKFALNSSPKTPHLGGAATPGVTSARRDTLATPVSMQPELASLVRFSSAGSTSTSPQVPPSLRHTSSLGGSGTWESGPSRRRSMCEPPRTASEKRAAGITTISPPLFSSAALGTTGTMSPLPTLALGSSAPTADSAEAGLRTSSGSSAAPGARDASPPRTFSRSSFSSDMELTLDEWHDRMSEFDAVNSMCGVPSRGPPTSVAPGGGPPPRAAGRQRAGTAAASFARGNAFGVGIEARLPPPPPPLAHERRTASSLDGVAHGGIRQSPGVPSRAAPAMKRESAPKLLAHSSPGFAPTGAPPTEGAALLHAEASELRATRPPMVEEEDGAPLRFGLSLRCGSNSDAPQIASSEATTTKALADAPVALTQIGTGEDAAATAAGHAPATSWTASGFLSLFSSATKPPPTAEPNSAHNIVALPSSGAVLVAVDDRPPIIACATTPTASGETAAHVSPQASTNALDAVVDASAGSTPCVSVPPSSWTPHSVSGGKKGRGSDASAVLKLRQPMDSISSSDLVPPPQRQASPLPAQPSSSPLPSAANASSLSSLFKSLGAPFSRGRASTTSSMGTLPVFSATAGSDVAGAASSFSREPSASDATVDKHAVEVPAASGMGGAMECSNADAAAAAGAGAGAHVATHSYFACTPHTGADGEPLGASEGTLSVDAAVALPPVAVGAAASAASARARRRHERVRSMSAHLELTLGSQAMVAPFLCHIVDGDGDASVSIMSHISAGDAFSGAGVVRGIPLFETTPLLRSLDAVERRVLMGMFTMFTADVGDDLLRRARNGDGVYLILQGSALLLSQLRCVADTSEAVTDAGAMVGAAAGSAACAGIPTGEATASGAYDVSLDAVLPLPVRVLSAGDHYISDSVTAPAALVARAPTHFLFLSAATLKSALRWVARARHISNAPYALAKQRLEDATPLSKLQAALQRCESRDAYLSALRRYKDVLHNLPCPSTYRGAHELEARAHDLEQTLRDYPREHAILVNGARFELGSLGAYLALVTHIRSVIRAELFADPEFLAEATQRLPVPDDAAPMVSVSDIVEDAALALTSDVLLAASRTHTGGDTYLQCHSAFSHMDLAFVAAETANQAPAEVLVRGACVQVTSVNTYKVCHMADTTQHSLLSAITSAEAHMEVWALLRCHLTEDAVYSFAAPAKQAAALPRRPSTTADAGIRVATSTSASEVVDRPAAGSSTSAGGAGSFSFLSAFSQSKPSPFSLPWLHSKSSDNLMQDAAQASASASATAAPALSGPLSVPADAPVAIRSPCRVLGRCHASSIKFDAGKDVRELAATACSVFQQDISVSSHRVLQIGLHMYDLPE